MLLKRIIVGLITLALLTPSVVISPRYAYGSPRLDKLITYDAARNVFVDKAMTVDNWCRLGMAPVPTTGKLCREGIDHAAILLVIPQTNMYARAIVRLKSGTMRREQRRDISRTQLAYIAEAAADTMCAPAAVTRLGLSFDRSGRPVSVFSQDAVKCDALGWIIKKSCDELAINKHNRKIAYRVSEILDQKVIELTGCTLVTLNDEYGRSAVIAALRVVAKRLRQA
jgi:hypothetical protein